MGVIHPLSVFYFYFSAAHAASFNKALDRTAESAQSSCACLHGSRRRSAPRLDDSGECRMDETFQRRKFTELRFEYYVSGRILWFNDTMSIAGMLLGYAVELSLKYALIIAGIKHRGLLNGHKPLNLFLKCEEIKAIPNVQASTDLLQYVSDMFNRRYPSQVVKTSAEANARGHAIGQSLDLILAYDDLIIQIDDALRERCSDDSVSIGLLGAHFVNRPQGKGFFHCNVAALKNTDIYRVLLEREYAGAEEEMKKQGLTEQTISYNLDEPSAKTPDLARRAFIYMELS